MQINDERRSKLFTIPGRGRLVKTGDELFMPVSPAHAWEQEGIFFNRSLVLADVMGVPYLFDPTINLLSFVFSAGIGVVFGVFTARRAARMNPIEALRHE